MRRAEARTPPTSSFTGKGFNMCRTSPREAASQGGYWQKDYSLAGFNGQRILLVLYTNSATASWRHGHAPEPAGACTTAHTLVGAVMQIGCLTSVSVALHWGGPQTRVWGPLKFNFLSSGF